MKFYILLFTCLLATAAGAQSGRRKQKISYAKGTIFGYWGYNRTVYTKSDLHVQGPGYDFELRDAKAADNPKKVDWSYFNPNAITVPQFNIRAGYYFRDHWAIGLGYDHFKYIFRDHNEVLLNGTIASGVDTVTNWSGTYTNEPVVTDRRYFHYENSDGLNFIKLELIRTDQWLRMGNNGQFALSTNLAVAAGPILSFNDFTFAGRKDMRTISLSGLGVSAGMGVRLEFFRHIFLQSTFELGYVNQMHVRTRPNDVGSYAKQQFGYAEWNTLIGFFLYLRQKNGCNTCPHW